MANHRRLFSLLFSLTISLFWFSHSASAAILAIDYGTDFIKASVIKPGVAFDVLLNRDSKRKIQSSVAWKGEDRLFGSDAFNLAARFPMDSFSYLKLLQGAPHESDGTDFFKTISPVQLLPSERGTTNVIQFSNATEWSVEELVAMQFSYIKELAETVGGPDSREPVRDVVVAVPSYYTQFERDAVVDALEIAGLRLAALVNDGTSVALNFAMSRTFESKEWHVIYDAGAGGVRASVVSFETVQTGKKGKDNSQTLITVAGVGFDRSAGGLELTRRLRDMLALDFEVKHKKKITDDARGMAKLWKEAERVKAILSANNEATVSVESVAFDMDYRTKVTRASFEAACSDLQPKFSRPITDALENTDLNINDIKSVILFGGHSRTPMVQASIKSAVGDSKIATSVNADEAAVLGAALFGASISPQFRTKDIKVTDIVPYDIQISYLSQPKVVGSTEDDQIPLTTQRTLHTLVFPAGSKVGTKKTMTFKRKDDFVVTLSYKNPPGYGISTDLLEAGISGVKEALDELTKAGAIDPVVKATLVLSESGFAGIQDAIVYGEIKKESFTDKLKGLFGGSNEEGKNETSPESPEESASTSATSAAQETEEASSSPSSSASSASPSPAKKGPRDTIPLTLSVKPLSIPALTPTEIRHSRDRLIAVDTAEAAKRRREEARNGLEAYLYRLRDLLEEENDNSPFKKCSTEEERKTLSEKVHDTLHWMSEEGDHAQLIDFWDKKDRLETLERPIHFRYKEIEAFPSAFNESQRINIMTNIFLTEARKNLTMEQTPDGLPAYHTAEELVALERSLRDHEEWLTEWVEKQRGRKENEDRVILTTEMKARAKALEKELLKLMRRKAPPKKKTSSSKVRSSTQSSTSTSSSSSSAAQSTPSSSPGPRDEL